CDLGPGAPPAEGLRPAARAHLRAHAALKDQNNDKISTGDIREWALRRPFFLTKLKSGTDHVFSGGTVSLARAENVVCPWFCSDFVLTLFLPVPIDHDL